MGYLSQKGCNEKETGGLCRIQTEFPFMQTEGYSCALELYVE